MYRQESFYIAIRVMLYSINVNDLVWPTGILDDDSRSDLVISRNDWLLLTEFIVKVFLKWDIRIGPSKLTALHLSYHFINPFMLFFDNHILIGAEIMNYLELLISWIVGNMRGKGVNDLLVFKHQQLELICAHTCVLDHMLIFVR